jgi:hypothetical protein
MPLLFYHDIKQTWGGCRGRTEEVQHGGDSEYGKNWEQGEWSKGLLTVYERRMPHTHTHTHTTHTHNVLVK